MKNHEYLISNPIIMRVKPVLLSMIMLLMQGNGELFDFHAISSRQDFHEGESMCQNLGYDGLAIINTPETFAYALTITVALR